MRPAQLLADLRDHLSARGASLVACADLQSVPEELREGLPRAVLIAVALDPEIIAGLSHGPTAEYLEEYKRVNVLLAELSAEGARFLQQAGWRALADEPSKSGAAGGEMRTPLPHKTVATLSGVGWIGRCALLVTPQFGSAVRLNRLLTDAPLPVGQPEEVSRCGTCDRCVQACPAGAPQGGIWQPGIAREEIFDAHACRAQTRQLCPEQWDVHSICGICINACPFTQAYLARSGVTVA